MQEETVNLPALADAYDANSHPLHRMLARVADNIDLEALLEDWATENPAAFLRILMETTSRVGDPGGQRPGGSGFHVHLHPSLQPGPLDVGHAGNVIDHSD